MVDTSPPAQVLRHFRGESENFDVFDETDVFNIYLGKQGEEHIYR